MWHRLITACTTKTLGIEFRVYLSNLSSLSGPAPQDAKEERALSFHAKILQFQSAARKWARGTPRC